MNNIDYQFWYDFLLKNKIDTINNLSKKQQNILKIVHRLNSIVKTGQQPSDEINEEKLLRQCCNINDIKKEKKINFKTQLRESMGKDERDRAYDIYRLEEIVKKIDDLVNKETDLKHCLIGIGRISSQMSFNSDKNSIRKKYGQIQSKKGKNEGTGNHFKKLSEIEKILNDNRLWSVVSGSQFELLGNDMILLKKNVLDILEIEKYGNGDLNLSNKISRDIALSIANVIEFSDRYFVTFISRLVRDEIDLWEKIEQLEKTTINLEKKDDRYFFARLFCKIGEFLNELIRVTVGPPNTQSIFRSFKNLIEVRHKIVHNYSGILYIEDGKVEDKEIKMINEIVSNVKNHLTEIICDHADIEGLLIVDFHYRGAERFKEDTERLLRFVSGNNKTSHVNHPVEKMNSADKKDKTVKKKSTEDIRKILDKLIIKACAIFEKIEENQDKNAADKDLIEKKLVDQLTGVNRQYLSHKCQLQNQLDQNSYPPALDWTNKDIITQHKKSISCGLSTTENEDDKQLRKGHEENDEMSCATDQLDKNVRLIQDEVEYCLSIWDGHLKPKQDYHGDIEIDDQTIRELKEDAVWRGKKILEIIRHSEDIDDSYMTDASLVDKLYPFLYKSFDAELQLFPVLRKHEYIIQQSILIIIQLIIDLGKINESAQNPITKQENKNQIHKHFDKFVTSPFINEGRKMCKGSRSNGLAHNLLGFDRGNFYPGIFNIRQLSNHLDSYNCVLNKDKESSSVVSDLLKIGSSFHALHSYKESIEYLEKALDRSESHPEEIEHHELDGEYREIFGTSRYVCVIIQLLIYNLLLSMQYERGCEKLKEITEKVDFEKVCTCNNAEIKNALDFFYICLGSCYRDMGDYDRALKFFLKADSISKTLSTKLILGFHYSMMKKYDKLQEICDYFSKIDPTSEDKYFSLQMLLICYSSLPFTDSPVLLQTMWDVVDQMDLIYHSDNQYFRNLCRDNYFIMDIDLMNCKLFLISKVGRTIGLSESELHKLIEIEDNFHRIIGKLDNEIVITNLEVAECYLLLSGSYCCVYFGDTLDLDNEGDYLKKAREYFDCYVKQYKLTEPHPEDFTVVHNVCCQAAVNDLIYAYNNYFSLSIQKPNVDSRLKYLSDALELSRQYNVDKGDSLINFARYHARLGMVFSKIQEDQLNQKYSELALTNFNEAVRYFEWAITDMQTKECSLDEIMISKRCVACYKVNIARLKYDLQLFADSLMHCQELLNSLSDSLSEEEPVFRKFVKDSQEILTNIINASREILNRNNESVKADIYTMNYCRIKWGVEIFYENENFRWKYLGELSNDDLVRSIEMDISNIKDYNWICEEKV